MNKNYTVTQEWKPLSDIMGQDYDHTKNYILYTNEINVGLLRYAYTKSVPTNERGLELKSFSTIELGIDKGDDIYLKGSASSIDIVIIEKE